MRYATPLFLAVLLLVAAPLSAADPAPIRIGAVYNLTGTLSSIGGEGYKGMQLAAKLINAKGGVLGRQIELVPCDGDTDKKELGRAVTDMVRNQAVIAAGGLNDSGFAEVAGRITETYRVPFVTAGATMPSLPRIIGPYFFMAAFGDNAQAEAVADFAMGSMGVKDFWVLTDRGHDFTKTLTKYFRQRVRTNKGSVLEVERFNSGDRDLSMQIKRLKLSGRRPQGVFISSMPIDAAPATWAVREAGFNQPVFSGDGFDTPLLKNIPAPFNRNIYFATHVAYDKPSRQVRTFVAEYAKEYGRAPQTGFAALGFDTLNLIADAITRAGSTDRTAIRDALAATKGFKGVTGTISYPNGIRVPHKSVDIVRFENGLTNFVAEILPE